MARIIRNYINEDFTLEEQVLVAVIPVDAFTGHPVQSGVRVRIRERILDLPRRNLSGGHVFVERVYPGEPAPVPPPPNSLRIKVEAEEAGFFDELLSFPEAAIASFEDRRLVVPLLRRPESAADLEAVQLSGTVQRAGVVVPGVSIVATVPPPALAPLGTPGPEFRGRTDSEGRFVLPLRLPDTALGSDTVPVDLELSDGGDPPRAFTSDVGDGRLFAFESEIELSGLGDGPPLVRSRI